MDFKAGIPSIGQWPILYYPIQMSNRTLPHGHSGRITVCEFQRAHTWLTSRRTKNKRDYRSDKPEVITIIHDHNVVHEIRWGFSGSGKVFLLNSPGLYFMIFFQLIYHKIKSGLWFGGIRKVFPSISFARTRGFSKHLKRTE